MKAFIHCHRVLVQLGVVDVDDALAAVKVLFSPEKSAEIILGVDVNMGCPKLAAVQGLLHYVTT